MKYTLIAALFCLATVTTAFSHPWDEHVEYRFAENDGVKLHYAVAGSGPLVVFVHGFPDYWYTWKHQMEGLADKYKVVALDTRGYNKSDKPEAAEAYDMPNLVADIKAVIEEEDESKAIIVGHDWGGMISWSFAAAHPEMTEKLIIINLPHPKGLARELAENEQQKKNSAYARQFQQPQSHKMLNADMLSNIVASGDEELKAKYMEAFENSSFDAMMNYYRRNYPREPYDQNQIEFPKLGMPVLQFHGLNDTALLPGGLDGTWDEITADYTLVTIPGVGHWAHHEAPNMVTQTMRWWLEMRK